MILARLLILNVGQIQHQDRTNLDDRPTEKRIFQYTISIVKTIWS